MGESRKITGHLVTVVLFGALALAILAVLFRLSGSLALGEQYEIKAIVPQAGSLTQGTSVTMAGARVGTIKSVERRGIGALVEVRIDEDSVKPLPKDSTAQLAVRTPLGENFVEIVPGRSKEDLENGGTVQPRQGAEYVDVDQILSVLQGRTRDRARAMFRGLGATVQGKGPQLQASLRSTASVLEAGTGLTAQLKGDREQIADLVQQLGTLGTSIGERGESIRVLARQGVTTFRALADRDESVRELIQQLPPTLQQVKETTGTLQQVSDAASPVVGNLAVALRQVRPSVRSLAPAAIEGQGVVQQLRRAAPPLEGTLDALKDAAPELTEAVPELDAVFCQANPGLEYLKPYWRDVINFANQLGAASNSYDAIGHTIRLMPVVGENNLLGAPPAIASAAKELTETGLLQGSLGSSFDPFPPPGSATQRWRQGDPQLKGPADVASSGFKYPRIQRAC